MEYETIYDGEALIAKILWSGTFPPNLHFYTADKDNVQVSTWNYDKGKHLKAHSHKLYVRQTDRTCEVIFVKTGSIKSYFYSETNELVRSCILKSGDIVIILSGGHAYDILENQTQVLEVKNGPYPGIELDKKVIEN